MAGTRSRSGAKTKNALHGKLRQKRKNGQFYYRLIVSKGVRKEFALKTSDPDEAFQRAADLDSIWLSSTREVALAQMNAIRSFSKLAQRLSFEEAWKKYETHPDRAMPQTFGERKGYYNTFFEFVRLASGKDSRGKIRRVPVTYIDEVTPELCQEFSEYLKTTGLSVDTHNRKIKRLRKIFSCLKDYYDGENPFSSKALMRSIREETGLIVYRQAFTKEQEEQLLAVLSDSDPNHKLKDKEEIRVNYTIGIYTGQRLKDCVMLQWQNIDMKNRRLWVKQFKTGKEVTIPMAPELYDALIDAKEWKCNQYVTPKTAAEYNRLHRNGKGFENVMVDRNMLKPIRWIGLEPSVSVPSRRKKMTVYGFHSLRHSFASFCAEAGVPKATLLSILGTDSDIADKYYTHVSEESQRKAIEAIRNKSTTTSSQEKIDRVLKLLMPEDSKQPDQTSDTTLQQVLDILKEA